MKSQPLNFGVLDLSTAVMTATGVGYAKDGIPTWLSAKLREYTALAQVKQARACAAKTAPVLSHQFNLGLLRNLATAARGLRRGPVRAVTAAASLSKVMNINGSVRNRSFWRKCDAHHAFRFPIAILVGSRKYATQ